MSRKIGEHYEQLACKHLTSHGIKVLSTNFTTKGGEIDIIAQDQDTLVFVEVKYRRPTDYACALETITASKKRRLVHAAKTYLLAQNLYDQCTCRFDVIAFDDEKLQWIQDAFWV